MPPSSTPLAVSLGVSPRQPLRDFARQAATLEAEGVGRLWLIDSQLSLKDVYAGLYLAALQTRELQLGPGVTNPLTRHPTVTAAAAAALAELAPGRALLGLGAGDSAVYGLGWKPAPVAAVEASLRYLRAVLRGEEGEYEGARYRLPHVEASVPVWLAASRPRMCALGGALADGVILMGPADPDHVRRQLGWVEEGLVRTGRERSSVEVSLLVTVAAGEDRAAALDEVRSWASTEARLLAGQAELPPSLERFRPELEAARTGYDFAQHLSVHAGHQAAVSDELAAALAVAGTPAECRARLDQLRATGVDSLIFPLPGGGRLEKLRRLRDQVLG